MRLVEFAIGVLLALAVRRGWRPPVPFSVAFAIAAGAYLWAGFLPAYVRPVAVTVVPSALVIVAAATADLSQSPSVPRWRPIVKLGEWSFAFYLEHQLVMKVIAYAVRPQHLSFGAALGLTAVALVVAIVLAWATFTFLEKPLERRVRHDRTVRATAAI